MSALSALGVAPKTPAFPAVVACPLCQENTLHLFDDIVTDGIWLHCNACAAHGDIITFGAQIWNTSIPGALTRFGDLGVISSAEATKIAGMYDRAFTRQAAADAFWQETSAQIWNHGDDFITCRLRDYGVQPDNEQSYGLVGVAHPDQVAKLCTTLGRAKPRSARKGGASVVFPYYNLPGRIAGFLFVQCTTDFDVKKTFIPVDGYDRRKSDAGYFLLHTLLLPAPTILKNKQFIVDDPFWALEAQCRQFKYGLSPLPIAASYFGPEAVSYGVGWAALNPAPRFFHGAVATPELISQAATGRGYVCLTDANPDRRKNEKYTLQRLADMCAAAETWQKALKTTLTAANEMTAYSFATKLTIAHDRLRVFFDNYGEHFSKDFTQRVLRSIDVAPATPVKVHKKWVLLEQNNSWCNHVGNPVCNARIVITKIVQADSGEKIYSGRIFLDDWELAFTDDARRIENMGLMAYAAAIAAPHGKLVLFDRKWNKRSHLLSIQLYNPELQHVSTKSGWDESASLFRFSNYVLNNSGDVILTGNELNRRTHVTFPEPIPVGPVGVRQFLTPEPQNAFVWNIFSAIVTNLVAPIVRKDSEATALTPTAFDIAAHIGAALDCEHERTTALYRQRTAEFMMQQTNTATWPRFISSEFNDTNMTVGIPKVHNRPVFAKMPEDGCALALGYGWHSVTAPATPAPGDFTPLQYVLPAYIQHALRNRMALTVNHKSLRLAVMTDLHEWLSTTYGATFHLPQALAQLSTPQTAHEGLLAAIMRAVHAGKIDLIPRPRRPGQPQNYLLRRKEYWWINKKAVDNHFLSCKNIPPNWLGIIHLFIAAGIFGGEESVGRMPGILVRTSWCDRFWIEDGLSAKETG